MDISSSLSPSESLTNKLWPARSTFLDGGAGATLPFQNRRVSPRDVGLVEFVTPERVTLPACVESSACTRRRGLIILENHPPRLLRSSSSFTRARSSLRISSRFVCHLRKHSRHLPKAKMSALEYPGTFACSQMSSS